MERQKVIDKSTLVPIGALVLAFTIAAFITKVAAEEAALKEEFKEHKEVQSKEIDKVYHQLENINSKVDRLIERKR